MWDINFVSTYQFLSLFLFYSKVGMANDNDDRVEHNSLEHTPKSSDVTPQGSRARSTHLDDQMPLDMNIEKRQKKSIDLDINDAKLDLQGLQNLLKSSTMSYKELIKQMEV